jgi:benzoyl-CoA reductase/2-hydroxyglutaryl-CoA dehydratase subunit BcrC/BadD/HgdB
MTVNTMSTLTAALEKALTPSSLKGPTAVLSWPSVPAEIVRAAGLNPFVVRGGAPPTGATPAADAHLEPGIFPSRIRRLVDAALTGGLSGAACIVIPRTSDPDYKCFLYLREFARLGIARALPPVLLYDLLQSPGPDVPAYNAARTRVLLEKLASITGRQPSLDDVRHEIARTNKARAAARRLLALRGGEPRVTGAEVFPLLGAFWNLPPEEYAALAGEAADDIARRAPLAGPRVLLAGAPVDSAALHAAIEARGAIVTAEAGPWGSAMDADNLDGLDSLDSNSDPVAALAERYSNHTSGARTPVDTPRATDVVDVGVDAVVVSLPPDDAVFGWDYPALRDLLAAKRIPHICLHGDPYGPLSPDDSAQLDTLMRDAAARKEVGVGR